MIVQVISPCTCCDLQGAATHGAEVGEEDQGPGPHTPAPFFTAAPANDSLWALPGVEEEGEEGTNGEDGSPTSPACPFSPLLPLLLPLTTSPPPRAHDLRHAEFAANAYVELACEFAPHAVAPFLAANHAYDVRRWVCPGLVHASCMHCL